jgi:dienelactone hydrolase
MPDIPPPPLSAERINVLDTWSFYSDAPNAFYRSFTDEALPRLAVRRAAVARLQSPAEWERYRTETRQTILELAGPFPKKTPLNARVTGVVHQDTYRIEKIIFESQPNFFVPAALFVPASLAGKAPAILYCSGHSAAGFRSPSFQTMILNLVRKGFVVFAFDPIGQGERLQYFDPRTGAPEFADLPTFEHTRAGSQCFLTGGSLARYMIWDAIRSLDYLLSRPEVDSARIGVTGRSGGGTQTAYLAALDDRVLAAAPENYVTTFDKVLMMRGPQDPEQNFYRGIARGFDQPDLLIARAPKPTLLIATTRDIFNIDGTRDALAEARQAYAAFGAPDALTMTVDDADHASTPKNREATYAFFRQALGLPGDNTDARIAPLRGDDLRVTATGQVSTSLTTESVFSLNRREATRLQQELDLRRSDLPRHLATVKTESARLAGYVVPPAGDQATVFTGRYQRDGYAVEKYLLPVDGRYAIPVLAMVPSAKPSRVVLYLHPDGKAAQAGPGGEMESLVRQGCAVVAPDMLGLGELAPGGLEVPGNGPPRLWYGYVLLGKSMIGRQIPDLMRVARFAEARFGVAVVDQLSLARGTCGPLLLHAAAMAGGFRQVALIDAPISYRSIAMTARYRPEYIPATVPGALTAYDLPDLAACVAPRRLLLAGPRDASGTLADAETIVQDTAVITRAYAEKTTTPNFVVLPRVEKDDLAAALAEWLR